MKTGYATPDAGCHSLSNGFANFYAARRAQDAVRTGLKVQSVVEVALSAYRALSQFAERFAFCESSPGKFISPVQ